VLPTEGGNMVDCCCCRVGSHIVVQKADSCCEKARSLSSNGIFQSCHCLAVAFGIDAMLAGHTLFCCPVFNTALCWHHLTDGHTSHNK
jgi:hypothetical protein